jgi:hypothetical protein
LFERVKAALKEVPIQEKERKPQRFFVIRLRFANEPKRPGLRREQAQIKTNLPAASDKINIPQKNVLRIQISQDVSLRQPSPRTALPPNQSVSGMGPPVHSTLVTGKLPSERLAPNISDKIRFFNELDLKRIFNP